MTARLHFTEIAARRAIRAARKEGIHPGAVTIAPDGTITVHHAVAAPEPPAHHAPSSEFEDFRT